MATSKKKTANTDDNTKPTIVGANVSHKLLLAPMGADNAGQDLPYLGHARAVVIVCTCANTSPLNLSRTLGELGVDSLPFQQCVFGSVTSLGYSIRMDDIPDSPDTPLIKVVDVIQNAPTKS